MEIYCKCGCGEKVEIKKHHKYYGIPNYIARHVPHQHCEKCGRFLGKNHVCGSNKGYKWSEKSRMKQSNLMKRLIKLGLKKKPPGKRMFGNENPSKRLEVRRKISEAKKGRVRVDMLGNKHPKYHFIPKKIILKKLIIGVSPNKIASELGVSPSTISRKLKEYDIVVSENFRIKKPIDKEQIYKEYVIHKKSTEEISKMFKISKSMVLNHLHSLGVKIYIHTVSYPQKKLYEKIKSVYPEALLNQRIPNTRKFGDIVLSDSKIIIEFDGKYWHQDKKRDIERDNLLTSLGWKIFHIDSFSDEFPFLFNTEKGIAWNINYLKNIKVLEEEK